MINIAEFNKLMSDVFAPPKKGTKRMMFCFGRWWKWRSQIDGTLQVSDDSETWREPTVDESQLVNELFQARNSKTEGHRKKIEEAIMSEENLPPTWKQ